MRRRGFGGLISDEQWKQLVSSASRRPFSTGQALLHQGDTGHGVHLLLSGRVRVVSDYADGTSAPLAFRTCGEILGESVLAGGGRTCNATVTALSDGSTAYLTTEHFQRKIRELDIMPVLIDSALNRQGESDQIRGRLAQLPAQRRLSAALVHLASVFGEPLPVPRPEDQGEGQEGGQALYIPLSQQEIGGFVGLSRTSVHYAYTQLKELGLIRIDTKYVVVLDLARLEALSLGDDRT